MLYNVRSRVTKSGSERGVDPLRLPKQRTVRRKISKEKQVAAFSNLGWLLSAARTQREAAQILMDTADELFGWDACTFDLYSAEAGTVSTVPFARSRSTA